MKRRRPYQLRRWYVRWTWNTGMAILDLSQRLNGYRISEYNIKIKPR